MRNKLKLLAIVLVLSSCIKESPQAEFIPKFVVEGVIEEGEYPVVNVTHNIPKGYIIDKDQLEQLIVRWASVRVFTEGEKEILTLVRDDKVFPYYFYQGKTLKGVAGKRYGLEVIYNDIILQSETTIPTYKPRIEKLTFREVEDDYAIPSVVIHNDQSEANYLLYMKLYDENNYYSTSPKGFKAIEKPTGLYSAELLRGYDLLDRTTKKKPYYTLGDDIEIKVSNISKESQQLWSAYAQQSVQFTFLNYSSNFQGNIRGDAVGVWYGANSTIKRMLIEPRFRIRP